MPEYNINYTLNTFNNRNAVRMTVVQKLSEEVPGEGKGDLASKYTYYVESLSDGSRIYLRRPAYLHNGFDFVVCVENYNFNPNGRARNCPSHDDIISDLTAKKHADNFSYKLLFSVLTKIYECKHVDEIEMEIKFSCGYSSEMIIKTLKWLFIEQDIRYWNYSGRDMLWKAICNI